MLLCVCAQWSLTLCHPMNCSLPGSSVLGILQAWILEWVAISFSRGSSWSRDQTWVSCIGRGFFTTEPPGNVHVLLCLVAQSCLTLCNPMDCSLPGSSLQRASPGKNTGVGCQALLQGIFPNQGSNPGLQHCGLFTDWNTRESNQGLLQCKWILFQLRAWECSY